MKKYNLKKRYNHITNRYEKDEKIDEFIRKVNNLSKEYGFVITPEDRHGCLIVKKWNKEDRDYIKHANIGINNDL